MERKTKKEKKRYEYEMIAAAILFVLGIVLLILGIEENITIALMFSFIIIIIKVTAALVFKESLYKILRTIYWIFFALIIIGFFAYVFNITPNENEFQYDNLSIKSDRIGFVTNVYIETNGDISVFKLVKPTIFKCNADNNTVIYKINNTGTIYLLYDNNIGLHIIYVGYAYLYIYSIALFFMITGKCLLDGITGKSGKSKSKR